MAEGRLSLVIHEAIALKNTHTSRKLYKEWRNAELFTSVFSIFGLISASVDYEEGFSPDRTHSNCFENPAQIYRYFTLIFTLIAVFFLILRHNSKTKWRNKSEITYYSIQNGVTFGKKKALFSTRLIIEILILIIFPYPYLKGNIKYHQSLKIESNEKYNHTKELCYNVAELLYLCMFFRVFFIMRTSRWSCKILL